MSVTSRLQKALMLVVLLVGVGSLTACDEDDWEDYFEDWGGCSCGCRYDDRCGGGHWYEFWYW